MTDNNNSYFTLNNPSLNNKPQPTTNNATTKSGLLNRRQQHASYLPQLELPSLPPLSHLLTTDKIKKETNETTTTQQQQQQQTSDAAVAAAVAAGMIPTLGYPNPTSTTTQFYPNNNNTNTNNNEFVPTTELLIDPNTATTNPMMTTMDPMYSLQPELTNTNVMVQAAAAAAAAAAAGFNMNVPPNQALEHRQRQRQLSNSSSSSAEKIYSFVAIPGTNQKKRPRRRYDEIERLYHCNWAGCTKAYGTLNHLNAHVSMQKHGSKRHPAEFKEMRKEWRKQKKEREARKKANEEVIMNHPHMMSNTNNNTVIPTYNNFQPYGQIPTGAMSLNGFY